MADDSLVAVLDADVLVPVLSCDLLLSAFDHDLYQPVVTPTILDEVGRNLHADFPLLDAAAVDRRVEQVRTALSAHSHPAPAPGDAVEVVNPKDRHVAAVAVSAKADVVVTNDRRLHRQLGDLSPSVQATTADDFAASLVTATPEEVQAVVTSMAAKRRRPPMTVDQLLGQLRSSFPRFVTEVRAQHP